MGISVYESSWDRVEWERAVDRMIAERKASSEPTPQKASKPTYEKKPVEWPTPVRKLP